MMIVGTITSQRLDTVIALVKRAVFMTNVEWITMKLRLYFASEH